MARPHGTNASLVGQRFGRLIVLRRAVDRNTDSKPRVRWFCSCDCGESVADVRGDALIAGKTRSCGCWHAEAIGHRAWRHGEATRQGMTSAYQARRNATRRSKVAAASCIPATFVETTALDRWCPCGEPGVELDHVVPVSRGGCSALHNLQVLCKRCNRSKGAKMPIAGMGCPVINPPFG